MEKIIFNANSLKFNEEFKIYFNPNNEFNYSDGTAKEKYIFDTLKSSEDNSIFSPYLHSKIRDWSSEYHFTSMRQNILRPIKIQQNWNILEIGGGCGAITRYLVETGANITAVEGSFNRAKCIRQRCKGFDNLKVINSNVETVTFDQKFDMITLIGVFEYSGMFSSFNNPYIDALKYYKNLLSPNGILVIAIENRLGLKYFAGYNEDHKMKPYFGLEGRYGRKDVNTFGKSEFTTLLNEGNFENLEFYYPFPDYKLPRLILSNQAFETDKFVVTDLINTTKTRHYSNKPRANNMNYNLVWNSLHKNKLIADFSNSFLVIAHNSENNEATMNENVLGELYTTNRQEKYNTQTVFKLDEDLNSITALKKLITNNSNKEHDSDLIKFHHVESTLYIEGDNLDKLLNSFVIKNDSENFKIHLNIWINYLKEKADSNMLLSIYYDCLPSNLILDKSKKLNYIDKEWEINKSISIDSLLIRYFSKLKYEREFCKQWGGYTKMIKSIYKENNLAFVTKKDQRKIIEFDRKFRSNIHLPIPILATKKVKFRSAIFLIYVKLKEIWTTFINKKFINY